MAIMAHDAQDHHWKLMGITVVDFAWLVKSHLTITVLSFWFFNKDILILEPPPKKKQNKNYLILFSASAGSRDSVIHYLT